MAARQDEKVWQVRGAASAATEWTDAEWADWKAGWDGWEARGDSSAATEWTDSKGTWEARGAGTPAAESTDSKAEWTDPKAEGEAAPSASKPRRIPPTPPPPPPRPRPKPPTSAASAAWDEGQPGGQEADAASMARRGSSGAECSVCLKPCRNGPEEEEEWVAVGPKGQRDVRGLADPVTNPGRWNFVHVKCVQAKGHAQNHPNCARPNGPCTDWHLRGKCKRSFDCGHCHFKHPELLEKYPELPPGGVLRRPQRRERLAMLRSAYEDEIKKYLAGDGMEALEDGEDVDFELNPSQTTDRADAASAAGPAEGPDQGASSQTNGGGKAGAHAEGGKGYGDRGFYGGKSGFGGGGKGGFGGGFGKGWPFKGGKGGFFGKGKAFKGVGHKGAYDAGYQAQTYFGNSFDFDAGGGYASYGYPYGATDYGAGNYGAAGYEAESYGRDSYGADGTYGGYNDSFMGGGYAESFQGMGGYSDDWAAYGGDYGTAY